jgi:serine/threonine protein kinase
MVSKFYENGSLHNFSIMKETIRSNTSEKISTDPKSRELELALEIARTLRFLHSQSPPIVHGHLKPQNIMLSKNFHIRLGRSVELLL